MATGTGKWVGQAVLNFVGGGTAGESKATDFLSNTMKIALVNALPDQDTVEVWDDVDGTEITGTGYTAGGITLANKTLGYTSGTNVTKFDADDVVWTSSTITARAAVIYDNTPASAADKLVYGFIDFGANLSSDNNEFRITFDSAGIFTSTAS